MKHTCSSKYIYQTFSLFVGTISATIAYTEPTSLTLSWTLAGGTSATGYNIFYSNTDMQCFTNSDTLPGIAANETNLTLAHLEEGAEYTITVTALLTGGGTDEDNVTATTLAAGELLLSFLRLYSFYTFNHPAPSAPPASVSISDVISISITVQWGTVDCIHRNGDITGYSVRYGVRESGSTQTESVSEDATTEATISGLVPSTSYVIEVAAVNSAGIGVYSDPLTVETSVAG